MWVIPEYRGKGSVSSHGELSPWKVCILLAVRRNATGYRREPKPRRGHHVVGWAPRHNPQPGWYGSQRDGPGSVCTLEACVAENLTFEH